MSSSIDVRCSVVFFDFQHAKTWKMLLFLRIVYVLTRISLELTPIHPTSHRHISLASFNLMPMVLLSLTYRLSFNTYISPRDLCLVLIVFMSCDKQSMRQQPAHGQSYSSEIPMFFMRVKFIQVDS